MTEIQTIPIDELEEIFDKDIMCGGNGLKITSCPHGNRAVVKLKSPCCYFPQIFKCISCYTSWLAIHIARFHRPFRCACGKLYHNPEYVPI